MTTNHVSLTDAPLVLVPQHFGCIVYDRRTCQYLPFDREATGVLRDLSRRSLAEVLAACPDAPERARILAFCDWGSALGLFTLDDRWAGAVLEITPPHDHLTGPLTVHLELTARCNLQCRHCFAESSPSRGTHDELPLDELEQLFVDMASCGAFRLGITGGEPLLRGDLADVLRLAGRHGLSPCLTTNGLLITDDLARQLADMRLAWLNVSLDGASARTHDAVRGPGAFERTLSRITVLRRHVPFSLAFTVMAQNLDEIGVCAQLARDVGAQAAVFRPLYPAGRALSDRQLAPTFAQYRRAMAQLECFETAGEGTVCDVHPWSPQSRDGRQSVISPNFGCGAGNSVCSVSARGDVSPCSFLGPSACSGNIRERSLPDIWHDSEGFQRIRSLAGSPRCAACEHFIQCGGGCRARALAWTEEANWNAPDPWCMAESSEAGIEEAAHGRHVD